MHSNPAAQHPGCTADSREDMGTGKQRDPRWAAGFGHVHHRHIVKEKPVAGDILNPLPCRGDRTGRFKLFDANAVQNHTELLTQTHSGAGEGGQTLDPGSMCL